MAWPAHLKQLCLGGRFNQPIEHVVWPASLQKLRLGSFSQPLDGAEWPASLRRLEFAESSRLPVDTIAWPESLLELDLGRNEKSMAGITWPASLRSVVTYQPMKEERVYLLRRVEWIGEPSDVAGRGDRSAQNANEILTHELGD